MNRSFAALAVVSAVVLGAMPGWRAASAGGAGHGQEKADVRSKPGTSRQAQGRAEAGSIRGALIRPMVPEGGSGPSAPEEGAFVLRPGDLLELECATPESLPHNMTTIVDDTKIIRLLPIGLRELKPMAMVGGEPRPLTGTYRVSAVFEAQAEGKTIIRLNAGRRQWEYRIEVREQEHG